jgi:undecaprenyl-diphosphatase
MVEWGYAVMLGIVEGLTEFIPVSSTGHLIVAGHLLGFEGPRAATFEIFIQLGAILAVVFLYKARFLRLCSFRTSRGFAGQRGIILLGLTSIPALVFGAGAHGLIKAYLFTPASVALGLGIGGVGILVMERFLPRVKTAGLDALSYRDAIVVGLCQCLALWPGMSRSACTIVGGMARRQHNTLSWRQCRSCSRPQCSTCTKRYPYCTHQTCRRLPSDLSCLSWLRG